MAEKGKPKGQPKPQRRLKLLPGEKEIEVDLGGRKVMGVSRTFEIEKDAPIVIRLRDGSRLKIRLLIEEVIVTGEEAAPGVPLIMVRQAPVILYEAAPKATKS